MACCPRKRQVEVVVILIFLLGVATYALPLFLGIFYGEHELDEDQTITMHVEGPRNAIKTESLKLVARLPLGLIWGKDWFQRFSENRYLFGILGTLLGVLLKGALVDLTEVSWRNDGSFSAQHLALTRMCESLWYIFDGQLVNAKKRDAQLRRLVRNGLGEKRGFLEAGQSAMSRIPGFGRCFTEPDPIFSSEESQAGLNCSRLKYGVAAFCFHILLYVTGYLINVGEIGDSSEIFRERRSGYKLIMSLNASAEWDLVGSRKCSLMRVCRSNYQGNLENVNSLMGCGTHFEARKKFQQGSFLYNGSRVLLRLTTDSDPVGPGNAVLFVNGKRNPLDRQSVLEERGVLITLNPVHTLGDLDTQVLLSLDGVSRIVIQNNIESLLDQYETVTSLPELRVPPNQIDDDPLVEFLEAMVQNIFANSEYRLQFESSLDKKGGMAFGSFTYRAHVVLAFTAALICAFLMSIVIKLWKRSFAVRELTDLADRALMSTTSGHSAALALETRDHRFCAAVEQHGEDAETIYARLRVFGCPPGIQCDHEGIPNSDKKVLFNQ